MRNNRNTNDNVLRVEVGNGRYQIQAEAIRCGEDLCIAITGGENAHVGAVSLAKFEPERESATVSTICSYGHRDDQLAMRTAKEIACKFRCTVTVTVGIHIDHADLEEIGILEQNHIECVEKLMDIL